MGLLPFPRAGTDPGRAARATEVVPDQTGDAVAQLGNIAATVGFAMQEDRRDRNFQRAQVDLTREVNDLRLGVEEIGDPDQADQFWEQGKARLRQRYLEADGENAVLDPANRDKFGIAFDRLIDATAFSVGARNLGLRQSQREATFIEYTQEASRAGAGADPQTRATLFAQGDEMIASLLEAGVIDPEEAAKRRIALRGDVSNAHAIRMITDDPQAFLSAVDQGDFPGLDGDTLERYRAQATSALATAEKQAASAAEKAEKERQTALGNRLSEMRQIMADGRTPVDEAFLADPDVQAHPEFAETMAARSLRDENIALAEMTPDEIGALIAGERGKKVAHKFQTERLKVLEDWQRRHEEGFAADPIAYARSLWNGTDRPSARQIIDLPDFDPANPAAFGQALALRAQQGQELVDQGFAPELRILSDDERERLRAQAGLESDPASRAALAQTLATSLPRESFDRLSNVIDDPVFSHVGGLMASGGSRGVAEEVLRGQQVIDQGNVILPPVRDRTEPAFAAVSDFFADVPGGEALQATITKSADALYAARIRRSDPAGDIDEDVYRQALHEVMGGQGVFNARDAKGGMQEVRGALTPLPQNVGARDVERVIQGLSRDLLGLRQAEVPGAELREIDTIAATGTVVRPITRLEPEAAQARASAFLQAASISGGQPGINGEPVDADTLQSLSLRAVGPDVYQFVAPDGRAIGDLQSGGPFEFRLSELVRRYPR
ncbi:MAG: hypothetical protein KBT70_05780 [Roseovarius sp.]|uniref:hypothetical protein n=1 Tax=Roseovarius sp. TaxID=1486281 RepID=UPI001B63915C|nr:hypothetical protein [Roseovarius sp.]MBQ0749694.1 hypothetical protein [Roseovarius sp.]MBQ0809334.1 hypothetical protein [Roseovarius sp.]